MNSRDREDLSDAILAVRSWLHDDAPAPPEGKSSPLHELHRVITGILVNEMAGHVIQDAINGGWQPHGTVAECIENHRRGLGFYSNEMLRRLGAQPDPSSETGDSD